LFIYLFINQQRAFFLRGGAALVLLLCMRWWCRTTNKQTTKALLGFTANLVDCRSSLGCCMSSSSAAAEA